MGMIKYTQTQIISEFKNDFDDALEKFRKRKIQFTGVITGIEYSRCGKEVQLRAEFDSAYRQDNGVVAILLTKGIIIEKQDWFLITSIAIWHGNNLPSHFKL